MPVCRALRCCAGSIKSAPHISSLLGASAATTAFGSCGRRCAAIAGHPSCRTRGSCSSKRMVTTWGQMGTKPRIRSTPRSKISSSTIRPVAAGKSSERLLSGVADLAAADPNPLGGSMSSTSVVFTRGGLAMGGDGGSFSVDSAVSRGTGRGGPHPQFLLTVTTSRVISAS